jgi:GT2 family glycosyltransferase
MTEEGLKSDLIDQFGFSVDQFGVPSYSLSGMKKTTLDRFDGPQIAFFCGGDHVMVRHEVLNVIGYYDPQYFSLNEDEDLCWRIWLAGWTVVVHPRAVAYHVLSATMRRLGRKRIRYHSEKNMLTNLVKNYELKTLVLIIPRYISLLAAEVVFLCISRKSDLALADISAVAWVLANLRAIWSKRLVVQSFRRVDDRSIRGLMYPGSYRIAIHLHEAIRDPRKI